MENNGIVSYGADIPRFRIKAEDIASVWGKDGNAISKGLGINEKSVPSIDQDTVTISVEAARAALKRCTIDPQDIGAIYIGSESHPYAVKPTGTIVGEAIGATPDLMVADYEFACKAGTAAILPPVIAGPILLKLNPLKEIFFRESADLSLSLAIIKLVSKKPIKTTKLIFFIGRLS